LISSIVASCIARKHSAAGGAAAPRPSPLLFGNPLEGQPRGWKGNLTNGYGIILPVTGVA